jgi:UDP-N-acetylglucosamine acyltransferase
MIHDTAIVHPDAQIDPSVEIGPWCTVGANVKMGPGCRLISHVVVDGWTTMGSNNTVFPFAVLGAVPQDLKYKGEKTELIIGSGNTIRESVTLNLGTVQGGGKTQLGDGNLLMAYVHFGHDCIVGNHNIFANNAGLAGHVTVEDYATIGGQSGVSQFLRVGSYAYVGGQSGADKDVLPYCIALGARPLSVKGTNIVGLRRKGFSAETITKINEAIKLWTRPDIQKEQCLMEIESQYGEFPEIQKMLTFIRKSEMGVVR